MLRFGVCFSLYRWLQNRDWLAAMSQDPAEKLATSVPVPLRNHSSGVCVGSGQSRCSKDFACEYFCKYCPQTIPLRLYPIENVFDLKVVDSFHPAARGVSEQLLN